MYRFSMCTIYSTAAHGLFAIEGGEEILGAVLHFLFLLAQRHHAPVEADFDGSQCLLRGF